LALLITAGAPAATVSSTFTLNGSAPFTGTSLVITGTATMSGVYLGNGTFTSTVSITSSTPAPFTITVTAGNTLTGTFTLASGALSGTDTGSLTITGGTGTYAGYTGTFSSLKETGATAISGTSASFTLTCTGAGTVNTAGGGTTTPVPNIASVTDGASYTANVAQGAFFTVWGSNLAPSNIGLTNFPRPTSQSGVKVTFTPASGGAGTDTYLIYIGTGQINALLPSTVLVGNYNVTVTNGTVSNQVSTKVVASKPGLFTQDQSGTGLAVVFNYISQSESDVDRLTTGSYNGSLSSPAKPGQTLVAWGTGIGPWAAGDNTAGITHDFSTSQAIAAIVGGVSIPVVFAGLNGYAGEDQINFTLPNNVPTGCSVTLQISVAGVLSAPTSIAIAPSASATACVDPNYTTQQLQTLDQGGTITAGGFSLSQSVVTDPSFGSFTTGAASGLFSQITGYQLSSSSGSQSSVILANSGGCVVTRSTSTESTVSAGHATALDAGTVTLTGPAGSNLNSQKLTETSNTYSYSFGTPAGTGSPSLVQGTYTLNGAGGNDVGPFNTSITLGPPFTLSSPLPSTVTESAGLTLNWTGGNASDVVQIVGDSVITSGTGANKTDTGTGFVCTTTAGQKTFTVPASILTLLPTFSAAQVAAGTAAGILEVISMVTPITNFNATLKKDNSNIPSGFESFVSIGDLPTYQ
jgi:uncharacterized protein (TIGR03437 family)